ncbi:MAG: hypothetical protein EA359_07265 [Balneolaceae bacterium]|nr:MAG: hypothetical protein EA359_07265 [Balneolaceae bacterium]
MGILQAYHVFHNFKLTIDADRSYRTLAGLSFGSQTLEGALSVRTLQGLFVRIPNAVTSLFDIQYSSFNSRLAPASGLTAGRWPVSQGAARTGDFAPLCFCF